MVRALVVRGLAAMATLALASPTTAQELLPNLRALPPSNLSIVTNASTGNPELRLAATSWNSGAGPLELIPGAAGQAGQDVYQRIYLKGGGSTQRLAGTFIWHPDHNHFHFQEYALYTLRPVNAPGASQRQSYKTSFCVMDTTEVDSRMRGAPNERVYATCNAVVQGMSVGWGDTYGANLAGQAIELTGNPDGLYELTVAFDPANHLEEISDADNTACVLLQISVTNRTVQNMGGCGTTGGAPTITSIDPAMLFAGTATNVTIKGTNFSEGLAVGFENGSGAAPVASNVVMQDANTITAIVTVKNGGSSRDLIWDLRVGSAVRADAVQVVR
jgi:hypothetical protein